MEFVKENVKSHTYLITKRLSRVRLQLRGVGGYAVWELSVLGKDAPKKWLTMAVAS